MYKFWPQINKTIFYTYRCDIFVYTVLFVSTIFVNKYVLSVLKFTYPTVFQGWQTFVGFVVLKILSLRNKLDVTTFDRSAVLNIVPHCFYFVGAIVAGSKALALLPVPVFVCVGNLSGACVFLATNPSIDRGLVTITAGLLTIGTAVSIIVLDISLPFADSGYSWLLAHIAFVMAQIFHARDFSPRYTDMDRLYYSNIFRKEGGDESWRRHHGGGHWGYGPAEAGDTGRGGAQSSTATLAAAGCSGTGGGLF